MDVHRVVLVEVELDDLVGDLGVADVGDRSVVAGAPHDLSDEQVTARPRARREDRVDAVAERQRTHVVVALEALVMLQPDRPIFLHLLVRRFRTAHMHLRKERCFYDTEKLLQVQYSSPPGADKRVGNSYTFSMQTRSKMARKAWAVLAVLMIVSMLFSMIAYGF